MWIFKSTCRSVLRARRGRLTHSLSLLFLAAFIVPGCLQAAVLPAPKKWGFWTIGDAPGPLCDVLDNPYDYIAQPIFTVPPPDSSGRIYDITHKSNCIRFVPSYQGAGAAAFGNYCPAPGIWWQATKTCEVSTCPTGYISEGGKCLPADRAPKSHANSCPSAGNPINIATGNKWQKETDYAGPAELRFERHYNSKQATAVANIGVGWTHTYARSILPQLSGAWMLVHRPDGKSYNFIPLSNGGWVSDADVSDRLVVIRDNYNGITGWSYTVAADDSVEMYDAAGRLISITTRTGQAQALTYTLTVPNGGDGDSSTLDVVTDYAGRQLHFTYDGQKRVSTLTDPAGGSIGYSYDGQNNLVGVTYPNSTVKTYHYNESAHTSGANLPNALTGITDESSGRYATFKYDTQGRAISTEHAGGVDDYALTYNVNGTSTVTDPLGTQRTYSFQSLLGVARSTGQSQPGGSGCGPASSAATYDANGNAASRTDFNGNVTNYAYDLARNLETSRTEAFGTGRARTITTQWHSTYRLPTLITEAGRTTGFTHDASGNVLTKTVTDTATSTTRTWIYTYNSLGQVLTANGPRTDVSDVTTYTYYTCTTGYQCGQVQTITNAAGHVTTFNTYNAQGQPLTITDPNGVMTTLTYDARQRLASRTVGSELTTFTYWPTGLLRRTTLPDSSFIEYSYDAAHRLTGITDSEGNYITYTLDAMGNRTAEEVFDPSSALTQARTRVFDSLSRLWKDLGAAGTAAVTTTFGYDANGNQTTINAPLSRNTVQTYDELNRLTQVTDPLSGITQYGYNALDQLISVTDPRSKVTSYTTNALDDLTQQLSPDTGTTANTYDSGGNLQTSTDARSKTGTYTYDALNRPAGLTYPDQTLAYTYDSGTNQKGRLTQVTDNSGSTSWTYDTQGRVLSRQQTMGSISKTVGYAYDASGRLQTLTLPSGNTVTYRYSNGKVASLTLNGSTTILSNVLYQPFGPTRGWTWGNSTLAIREYDLDGKITDIDSAGLKTYSYDDAFRITGITDASDSSLSQTYGYDLLDRLTSATGTSLNQGWTYDANGNRLTQTGSQASTFTISGTSNRLSSVSGALTRTYGYDNAGNTTNDGTATFTYNDAGRMVSATKASVTTNYSLNALGQRVRKTVSSVSRYFVYDEVGHLVGEYDNSGSLLQETIWFGDTPVAMLKPNGGSGVNVFYIHTDHLNTPKRISRPSDNTTVWRWDSDPYGTTASSEDPDGDSNLFAYNLRFPGQYLDSESELRHNYFRDYDPATGRYVQSDPIGLRSGLNTYAYVSAKPLLLVDPAGLGEMGARIGGAIGAGGGAAIGGLAGGTVGGVSGSIVPFAGTAAGVATGGAAGATAGAALGATAGAILGSAIEDVTQAIIDALVGAKDGDHVGSLVDVGSRSANDGCWDCERLYKELQAARAEIDALKVLGANVGLLVIQLDINIRKFITVCPNWRVHAAMLLSGL